MNLLRWSLICLVMACSTAHAQDVRGAAASVERHVSDWQRRGVEPSWRDDSAYRALFRDLQATGVILAGEPYSFDLIGRTHNFAVNASRPCLSVRSTSGATEGFEFFLEHGAAGSRVVSVRRFSVTPGVAYIAVPVTPGI